MYLLFSSLFLACEEEKSSSSGLTVSTESLDFGDQPVGTEETQTLTITNQDFSDISILSLTLIGDGSSVWEVTRGDDTELSTNESLEVSVTYKPSALGSSSPELQIRTTYEDQDKIYIALSGNATESIADEDEDGFSPADGDCNDGNGTIYPNAPELCDGIDNDCDGTIPDDEIDQDIDGFRLCNDDCDDDDFNVYPGAEEICDGKDSDCDGYIPDDVDHDGDGYTLCDDDCDDDDPEIWPDNPEVCDGIDNDCSGSVDDIDLDGDGYSPCLINGDCDDNDPNAYPIVLDRAAPDEGDGSMEEPYNSLSDALDNLDPVCRTIVMMPGTYTMGLEWTEGFVAFNGGGESNDQVVINPSGSRIIDLSNGASMRLSNLTLEGGQGAGDGGAIRVTGSDLELNNVLLQNNQSVGDGGAVALSSGTLTLNSSQFIENVSEDDGGAIAILSGTLVDNGSVFYNNTGIRGGAILLDVSDAFIYDSSFHSNNASGNGGSIEFSSGAALTIERSEFWLNSSAEMGGAISVVNHKSSGSVIRNNLFQDNSTLEKGGAISFSGFAAGLMLANNSFVANSSVLQGAALYDEATDSSELYIWSNIFHANDGNYALYIAEGTAASLGYNTAFLTTSLVPWYYDDTVGPGNNTEEDPIFVQFTNDGDPTNDDLQLDATSPAIDAGPSDGAPPFYTDWNDLDGTQNDRGHLGGPGAAP